MKPMPFGTPHVFCHNTTYVVTFVEFEVQILQ